MVIELDFLLCDETCGSLTISLDRKLANLHT